MDPWDLLASHNHGELELRDFVLWRKRSFGTQSERGERFAERLMTVVRTARKQGKAVLDFMVRSIRAYIEGTTPPRLLVADLAADHSLPAAALNTAGK